MKGSTPKATLGRNQSPHRKCTMVKGVGMPQERLGRVGIHRGGLATRLCVGPRAERWSPRFTKNVVETLIRTEDRNTKAKDDETQMQC